MREEYRKVEKRKKSLERKNIRRRRIKKFLKILMVISLFFILFLTSLGFYLYKEYKPYYDKLKDDAHSKVDSINAGTFKNKTKTIIYDKKGKVIKELAIRDYYYIESKDIQSNIKSALIAIEDERYYEHSGYDKKAIARAFYEMIKNKGHFTQGGSTITQQLVKLQFLTLDKTFDRKIQEILIATKLEKMYDKEKILEFYLNNVNYGNGAYGIETASKAYFNKPSNELNLSEIAFLTAIPNNPSLYNPLRNMDNTISRRNIVLKLMKDQGKISDKEYKEAKQYKIVLNIPKKKYKPENYAVSFILSSATKELMEKQGFKFKYSFENNKERKKYWDNYNDLFLQLNKKIRNGGFKIYTTLDMKKQSELQKSINKGLSNFTLKNSKTKLFLTQGSSVTIDNRTGDVIAIVGGRTQKGVDNTFNRAFLSYRQPGSIIKPLVAYTPAFENGMLSSSTMIDRKIDNGPRNAGGSYRGRVTLRESTERSINTIAYQLVLKYKPENVLGYLEKMNFSNIVPSDNNASIAVGGFTYGTNVLEMASAYSTLARNGEYIKPTGISKIIDVTGTVIYENKRKKKRIYDSGSAYLMTDVLKGVLIKSYATGKGLSLDNGMISAGKTGTTNDSKDAWFAGYTPYYTTVVWVGNDVPKSVYRLYGATYPGQIWKDYMNKIHKGLKTKDFNMPNGINWMYVNPVNGEVSKTKNPGWRKELVPEIYYEAQEKAKREAELKRLAELKKQQEEREKYLKELEEKRLLEEAERLKRRKEELAKYGLTEEEEQLRENNARFALNELENFHIYGKGDYIRAYELIKNTKSAIDKVKIKEEYNILYVRYKKEVDRLEKERYKIENPIEVKPKPESEEKPKYEEKPKPEDNSKPEDAKRPENPGTENPPEEKPPTDGNTEGGGNNNTPPEKTPEDGSQPDVPVNNSVNNSVNQKES